ncbi:hypothetical protein [Dyella sedimenti]|uniref:hypothetical protein n=1 Tax=Dyella sedimenti TaxID=2919947 RepID=UPI001FA9F507|nr:hypothetical protein [Dyella sedimenti]
MQELTIEQTDAVSGGDGITATAGVVVGATVGLIGGPVGSAVGALAGLIIWEGLSIWKGIG